MILLKKKILGYLPTNVIWFANRPSMKHCLNIYYKQSGHHKTVTGFQRLPFYTKLIDLSKELSQIEQDFHPKTAYEIRRALKDGITTCLENDIARFLNFYNEFADTKKLQRLSNGLRDYEDQLLITKAVVNQQDVVMHAYICDFELKRARLLHSASLFRKQSSPGQKAVIGRANRFLHFKDMVFLKEKGFVTYDLGGYAIDVTDQELVRINQFKDGFGGKLVEESDYIPFTGQMYSLITKLWKA